MDQLVILFACVAIVVFLIFPIWVIVRLSGLSNELAKTRLQIESLRATRAQQSVPDATITPPAPAAAPPVVAPVQSTPPEAVPPPITVESQSMPPPVPPPASPPKILPPPLAAHPTSLASLAAASSSTSASAAATAQKSQPPISTPAANPAAFNWEVFLGTKFLSWVGGFAAFLAVAFFLKYSIEHGLISPIMRAAMGFVFGAGLIVGGLVAMRKKYDILGHTLCAIGIVSLYGVTFACRAVYHFPFFDVVPTFALMTLITAAAFVLAVRLDGKFIAILGILGGFLTPPLLSTGVDNPLGLFSYIALLNIGLYAVALHRRWHFLVPLGAIGTAIIQIGWAWKFLGNHNTLVAMAVCLVFDLLFLAGFVVAQRMKRETIMHSRSVAALVFVSFGFALWLAVVSSAGWWPLQLLCFMFLADGCALALVALDKRASSPLSSLSGLAVFGILAAWTLERVDPHSGLLPWALGAYFVFALLHTAFPLIVERIRPAKNAGATDAFAQLFAPLALLLVIFPVLKDSGTPFLVWPAILLLDLLAIILASLTRSLVAVVASLVLTLITAAIWIFKIPVDLPHVPVSLLLIIGGFAVLFFAASLWLGRKAFVRTGATAGSETTASAHFPTTLPALSSLLPFVLIVMMIARLTLPDPTPIFGLGLLLVVLTLGLAKILRHEWLPACALLGVLAICYVWRGSSMGMYFLADVYVSYSTAFAWFIGFFAIFAAYPFVFRSAFLNTRGPWITAAAAGPLFFPLIYSMVKIYWPNNFMGLVPAAFVVPALLSLMAVLRLDPTDHPRRTGRLALFGGVALLFITLIFPIQLTREWITIAWALEGAALLWLFTRVPHRGLPWAGVALLAVAFVRLALNKAVLSYHIAGTTPIFNWYLYTYGIAIICMFAGAYFLKTARENQLVIVAKKVLPALGVILAFLLLNIEIADYFTEPGRRALALKFSGDFARDMTYTIAWALFALALLVGGIWKKLKAARFTALGLLGVVALKLAFHDLANLETLYRVAALFAVAVIMILCSFLYQKYIAPRDTGKTPPLPPPIP